MFIILSVYLHATLALHCYGNYSVIHIFPDRPLLPRQQKFGIVSSNLACIRDMSLGLWVQKFPENSGKITVLFRNNSAKNFPEICGRKFHETLMQMQHSNARMRSSVDGCFIKFTCLLTLCTLSRQMQPRSRRKADWQRKWRHSLRMYDWYFCL